MHDPFRRASPGLECTVTKADGHGDFRRMERVEWHGSLIGCAGIRLTSGVLSDAVLLMEYAVEFADRVFGLIGQWDCEAHLHGAGLPGTIHCPGNPVHP
jgi:hypothetical protein